MTTDEVIEAVRPELYAPLHSATVNGRFEHPDGRRQYVRVHYQSVLSKWLSSAKPALLADARSRELVAAGFKLVGGSVG